MCRHAMLPKHRAPCPPGEVLRAEFLQPLGMTETSAATKLGMPLNRLSEIVNSKRGISADTALKLSRLFKTTPQFWMNLQTNLDLYHARQRQLAATRP